MELNAFPTAASTLVACVVALGASMPADAYGQPAQAPASDPTGAGKAVFSKANCVGCHKWHGNGGGYGGDALSLRKTELTRDQIIETVACGRPGTGMPFFSRGAYDEMNATA
jgi:mono/diheme cytochrome c family protein